MPQLFMHTGPLITYIKENAGTIEWISVAVFCFGTSYQIPTHPKNNLLLQRARYADSLSASLLPTHRFIPCLSIYFLTSLELQLSWSALDIYPAFEHMVVSSCSSFENKRCRFGLPDPKTPMYIVPPNTLTGFPIQTPKQLFGNHGPFSIIK